MTMLERVAKMASEVSERKASEAVTVEIALWPWEAPEARWRASVSGHHGHGANAEAAIEDLGRRLAGELQTRIDRAQTKIDKARTAMEGPLNEGGDP